MAWTNSRIFTSFLTDVLNNTTAMDANSDTHKVALFDNSITPSQTVASASTAYGAGVWASGGVGDTPSWPAVGRDLASVTSVFSTNVYTFDAADTASADATTDLTNVFGVLVYDDTITTPVADQGEAFLYLGGAQTVTNGTFTLLYNAAGLWALTL